MAPYTNPHFGDFPESKPPRPSWRQRLIDRLVRLLTR